MTDWHLMFSVVQQIVRNMQGFDDGFRQILDHAAGYNAADYWQAARSTPMPFEQVRSWVLEGLGKLTSSEHWSLVMLDCGDCPDAFHLLELPITSAATYRQFTKFVEADVVCEAGRFPPIRVEKDHDIRLSRHHANELNHALLSPNQNGAYNCEASGYLLWLSIASLALVDPLRDTDFCRQLLKGRKGIIVMSGFEEIFFYIGTISQNGLGLRVNS